MNQDVAVRESVKNETSGFEMKPRSMEEAMKFCDLMAKSELVPKCYQDKPGNIMVAIQMGSELGLSPMRALRSIAVINGRATMWGDDVLAMVLASPVCEYVDESESTDKQGVCKTKRKGCAEQVSTFTLEDAKRAGLLGKQGPWQTNTSRMLKLRARGFGVRDTFADVLAGLVSVEEAMDLPRVEPDDPSANILEASQPLTLKDKLKAKVEAVEDKAQGDGVGLGGGVAVLPANTPEQTQQASDAPAGPGLSKAVAQDFISKVKMSESVRECSQVGNEAEASDDLTPDELKTIRSLVSHRLKELGGKK